MRAQEEGALCEARPREMFSQLPPIHFVPTSEAAAAHGALQQGQQGGGQGEGGQQGDAQPQGEGEAQGEGEGEAHAQQQPQPQAQQQLYECPLYKTSVRAGILSTTGQSTNFVLHIALPLPAGVHPSKPVLQGVAALCALSN